MALLLLTSGAPDNLLLADGASNLLIEAATTVELAGTAPMAASSSGNLTALVPIAGTLPIAASSRGYLGAAGWVGEIVDDSGSITGTLPDVNVVSIDRDLERPLQVVLEVATLSPSSSQIVPVTGEFEIFRDGAHYAVVRTLRPVSDSEPGRDVTTVLCEGLEGVFYDLHVGPISRPNHITSPHEDSGIIGGAPQDWTKEAAVEAWSLVDNNQVFDAANPKAIQLNNSEAAENAFMWQRFTVPAEHDKVPFAASAWVYVAEAAEDGDPTTPPPFGPAVGNQGLVIVRRDPAAGVLVGRPQTAEIGPDFPTNKWVRLQTGQLLPAAGQQIEVRCYAPRAWTVWGFVALRDGRWLDATNVDLGTAFTTLVDHAQDTAFDKVDRSIAASAPTTNIKVNRRWFHYEHPNIGGEIDALFDTDHGGDWSVVTTRDSRAATLHWPQRGVDRTATVTITKTAAGSDDTAGWTLIEEGPDAANGIIFVGQGDGIARDEWGVRDGAALGGTAKERVEFGRAEDNIGWLRSRSQDLLDRVKVVPKMPEFTIAGDLVWTLDVGDTVTVNLNHGRAVYSATARIVNMRIDPRANTARLTLNPA